MYYEWDPVRARRMFMLKFAVAWLAAIVVSAAPIWFALMAGAI